MLAPLLNSAPEELLVLLLIAGAVAIACGFTRVAVSLMGTALLMVFGEEIGRTAYRMLPWWALILAAIWIAIFLVKSISEPLLGRDASNHMIGTLAAYAVRFMIRLPFRVVGWFWRLARGH